MLTINIIGAGAVGQTVGHLLVKCNVAKIQVVLNTTPESSQRAINFIGQGEICTTINDLPCADLILLTVPDQQIVSVAENLSISPNLQSGTVVLHCSGALNSECLSSLRTKHCALASIHPALSFTEPHLAVLQFANTLCALEGDVAALNVLTPLFTTIGGQVYQIKPEHKTLYHVAAVFATNYTVTLVQQAYDGFLAAGLSKQQAKTLADAFLSNVSKNMEQVAEPKQALTGPLQRGDVVTIERHLQVLTDPDVRALYLSLAHATLSMTSLDDEILRELKDLLNRSAS